MFKRLQLCSQDAASQEYYSPVWLLENLLGRSCFKVLWQVKELPLEIFKHHWISWILVLWEHRKRTGFILLLGTGQVWMSVARNAERKCSISTLSWRWGTLFSKLPVVRWCALKMPKLAEKCDTVCTPASTVAWRCEALVFCCVATSTKNEMGTRICRGGKKRKIIVVSNVTACLLCNLSTLCSSSVLFLFWAYLQSDVSVEF